MHIKHLNLVNFRNYDSVDIALQPGINLLLGGNGEGKTSIVESIIYLSSLVAPRHGGYVPMIKMTTNQALIRALAKYQERENLVELELNSETKNRAKVNRSDTSSPREILGYIKTVSFTPEDSRIIHDDPSDRRAFIDQLLIQFTPRLAAVFSDYERALKQRNSLLKSSRGLPKNSPGLSTLDAWDASLIEHGAEIISQRFELATKLAPYLSAAYKSISEDNREATLTVVSTVLSEGNDVDGEQQAVTTPDRKLIAEKFKERLIELRSKELERGVTLVGPHRDELKLMLGEYPAKGYISYGEAWSFAVSLKLASAELLRAEAQAGDPILILDDVFSSLDDQRLERLLDLVSNYEQVIITDAIRGKQESFQSATRFLIADGKVTQLQ